jgi:hypothetical protein
MRQNLESPEAITAAGGLTHGKGPSTSINAHVHASASRKLGCRQQHDPAADGNLHLWSATALQGSFKDLA